MQLVKFNLKPTELYVSNLLTFLLLFLLPHFTLAQPVPKYQEAMLDGKPDGLMNHISKTIQYPNEAREDGIQGFTLLKFKIDSTGKLDSIDILYAAHKSLSDESLRLVLSTKGKWQPAMRKGKPQDTWQFLPVSFILESEEKMVTFIRDNKKAVGYLHYKEGLKQYEAGNASEAAQSFTIAHILDHENTAAVYNNILILVNEGDYDLACYKMNKLIEQKDISGELKKDIQALMGSYCKE